MTLARRDPGHGGVHGAGTGERPCCRQARGYWAFGCVLYEMLTGRKAFEGEDVPDTLASILKSDAIGPASRLRATRC